VLDGFFLFIRKEFQIYWNEINETN
jgi:hypothetical protein